MSSNDSVKVQEDNIVDLDRKLPSGWNIFLYQKSEFKKIDRDNKNDGSFGKVKPYTEILRFDTLGQFMYLMKMFEETADHRTGMKKIDKGHFIFMKDGIKPLWEDEKNIDGGTYSLKINHDIGFQVFRDFMFYIIGETMNDDMANMNGISISCIPGQTNKHTYGNGAKNQYSTYIKIWNGNPKNNMQNINAIIPKMIIDTAKLEHFMYQQNESKSDFNLKTVNKIAIKHYEVKKPFNNYKKYDDDDDGFISVKKKGKK
jgi:hypothetical protein